MALDEQIDGWRSMLELAIGCWLIVSPFILQFFSVPNASAITIGLGTAITVISLLSIAKQQAWEEWVNLILAVALILSPWMLDFVAIDLATWNALAKGAILAVVSINALGARQTMLSSAPNQSRPTN